MISVPDFKYCMHRRARSINLLSVTVDLPSNLCHGQLKMYRIFIRKGFQQILQWFFSVNFIQVSELFTKYRGSYRKLPFWVHVSLVKIRRPTLCRGKIPSANCGADMQPALPLCGLSYLQSTAFFFSIQPSGDNRGSAIGSAWCLVSKLPRPWWCVCICVDESQLRSITTYLGFIFWNTFGLAPVLYLHQCVLKYACSRPHFCIVIGKD